MTEQEIKTLYEEVMEYPNKILEIFNDFYGEEKVDMQGFPTFDSFCDRVKEGTHSRDSLRDEYIGFILVHFPEVKITNEHDRFVVCKHFYVKVGIKASGKSVGYFGINRSEYQRSHLLSDYMHSHVSGIPKDDFTRFLSPCLGSGPIRSTISTLSISYDESIWELFCLELEKYMGTESLNGGPYRRLENIGKSNKTSLVVSTFAMPGVLNTGALGDSEISEFIRYFINRKLLTFNYVNNSYSIAMSYKDFSILVSNEFIAWYNNKYANAELSYTYSTLLSTGILRKCIIKNNEIQYFENGSSISNSRYEGRRVCTFKGDTIRIHVVDDYEEEPDNSSTLLNSDIINRIAKAVLNIVNYKYGRKDNNEEAGIGTPAKYI